MQSPREERYPVQGRLRQGGGGAAASAVPTAEAGATCTAGTGPTMAETNYSGRPGSGRGAPSAGAEAREMLPAHMDPGTHTAIGEEYRRTTDNKAGYDAGTAARGGGSGGTTEAMTGGLAAGGAMGDPRREGMGDPRTGQM
ncbi:hypothetical protein ABPG75_011823 [Micractinium tetrahymenae]